MSFSFSVTRKTINAFNNFLCRYIKVSEKRFKSDLAIQPNSRNLFLAKKGEIHLT